MILSTPSNTKIDEYKNKNEHLVLNVQNFVV